MSTKQQHEALLVCVLITLGLPVNFSWWRFVYDILAQGESAGVEFLASSLAFLGFCATCVALAVYVKCRMEGDK